MQCFAAHCDSSDGLPPGPAPPSSQIPLRMPSSIPTVIRRASGTRGSQRESRSVRLSLCRSTSSRITVAVKVFVMLPIRK